MKRDIEFKEDVVINYSNKAVDTTSYVDSINGIAVKDSDRDSSNMMIQTIGYTVQCPDFIPNKLGEHKLIYKLDNYSYELDVLVKDTKAPVISVDQEHFEITLGDPFGIKNITYHVKDNLTPSKKIKVKLKGQYNVNKTGDYKLMIVASDEKGNKRNKKIILSVYEKSSIKIENSSLEMKVGTTQVLNVIKKGKPSNIEWFTSDAHVISISDGKVTALSNGSAVITAKYNDASATCHIHVISDDKNNSTKRSETSGNSTSNSKSDIKSSESTSKNASSYNKFFSGNSIDVYNQANEYAENIYNSKKAKGYQIMPTGSGFQVTFY